jgi:hypothetical protein
MSDERTIAHDGDWHADKYPESLVWRKPNRRRRPYAEPFRTCGYCGSIHPDDLISLAIDHPIRLEMADWKYGWPHKFYVKGIPNPIAGKQVEVSSTWRGGKKVESTKGPAPAETWAKFYTVHLLDTSEGQIALFNRFSPLTFSIGGNGRLHWTSGPPDV